MRESPATDIIKEIQARGAKVRAYDPVAMNEAKHFLPDIEYATDEYNAIEGADVLVFMTEWNQFRALDMKKVKSLLRSPKIADLRNIYEPKDMRALGFEYVGVGR
jgi:UDPglucose 6-dehydrogenase